MLSGCGRGLALRLGRRRLPHAIPTIQGTSMSDLLPQGLKFLQIGWWVTHAVAIWLIYVWGYRNGRRAEKLARLHAAGAGGERPR